MADKFVRHGATWNGDGLTSGLASGSTVTFTIATPGKVNWTGHGLAANALVYFGVTTAGVLPTGITAGTTYYVRNPGTNDFEVSATSGGASIAFSGTPSGTASATTTGAWNHLGFFVGTNSTTSTAVNAITGGTQGGGTIAAGDVVYIRSKTEAGADISFSADSAAQYIGASTATTAAPVKWMLDAGTIWSGISGTLYFTHSAANNNNWNLRANNWFIAEKTDGFTVTESRTDHYGTVLACVYNHQSLVMENWFIDTSAVNNGNVSVFLASQGSAGANGYLKNIRIKITQASYAISFQGSARLTLINLEIELTSASENFTTGGVINFGSNIIGRHVFIGGRIFGAGFSSNVASLFSQATSQGLIELYGFRVPATAPVYADSYTFTDTRCGTITGVGIDNKIGGYMREAWGRIDSRNDGYYPTLNATLPTSDNAPWSWLVYPKNISPIIVGDLTISKLYTASAAAKTVTLEMLVASGFTTLTKANVFMDVVYIDNDTGLPKLATTQVWAGGALASSSAVWEAAGTEETPTWGAVSFSRKKLEVTTPTSIKQDTLVIANIRITQGSASANDILFVCPDLQLS